MSWWDEFLVNLNKEEPEAHLSRLRPRLTTINYNEDDDEDLLSRNVSQYRNSRTGNARRAVSQPDHDILEGLPIRRWHKKAVNINTFATEKPDLKRDVPDSNGYPELPMPKDWTMLPERSQAILLAARRGTILRPIDDPAEKEENGSDNKDFVNEEDKPGLLTRKWALFSADDEPKEREYLARRRKGLRSLYGGSSVPLNTSGQMRKVKIRNVDSEGNSQIVEALIPEGQSLDAEIVEEEVTSPTQALAPGTKVEGVGVANSEGVLVPTDQVTPASQRRRPPPPKRKNKGPGRGRKKKAVAFASGTDGSKMAPTSEANGTESITGEANDTNGTPNLRGGNDGDDSIMQDAGQDGDEGSDDGSEGEDGDEGPKEDGEISATPEAVDSKTQSAEVIDGPEPPPPPEIKDRAGDEMALDEPKVASDSVNGSAKATVTSIPKINTSTSAVESESISVTTTTVVEESKDANLNSDPATGEEKASIGDSRIPNVALQIQEQTKVVGENRVSSPSKPSTIFSPNSVPVAHDSDASLDKTMHEETLQNLDSPHGEEKSSNTTDPLVQRSQSSLPPGPDLDSAEPRTTQSLPKSSAPVHSGSIPPTSQPASVESGPPRIRHQTPNAPTPEAPTPSPPTPLPSSFDPHHRGRLMESPRAPTMSPPTPARDLSSSPDLPLAGHRDVQPLKLDSAATINGGGSEANPLSQKGESLGENDEGAPKAAEDSGNINGLAASPKKEQDGGEDLLGSLEQSLK